MCWPLLSARVYAERTAGICESKAGKLERSQLFLKILNRLKYGKNDQRVTPEPLMRKHKTGSAKHGGIV